MAKDDKPVSLRRDKNEVIDDNDMLNVTPEYKAHVATKLSGILQKSYKEIHSEIPIPQDNEDTGIKLFTKSKAIFKPKETKSEPSTSKTNERPDLLAHRRKSPHDEDFQSVAVSPQWVLNQEGVHYKGPDESRSKVVTEL